MPEAVRLHLAVLVLPALLSLLPGKVEHGGAPITSGERYVIVLFMGYARNKSGRPAGWAMRRHTELVAAAAKASDGKDEL